MTKLRWIGFGLAFVTSAAGIVAGCGSDSDPEAPGAPDGASAEAGDASADGFVDAITNDGSIDAAECKIVGQACTSAVDCCSAACGTDGGTAGVCEPPSGNCHLPGDTCASGTECCTGSCVSGACSSKQCVPDKPTAGTCFKDADCCSGICKPDGTGAGLCASVNPGSACRTTGNPCGTSSECCSNLCSGGLCSDAVSFCTQKGDICAADSECCTGNCLKAAGAGTGTCGDATGGGASNCSPSGTVCQAGSSTTAGSQCEVSCCSRSCGPYGGLSGFKVCQPPSGCRPTGEVCRIDADCCGAPGSPEPTGGMANHCSKAAGAEFGRCDNGNGCREPGSICKVGGSDSCSAENNCCETLNQPSGNCNNNPANCCRQDALGIPRCLVAYVGDCSTPPPAGSTCATSADCCGNPCIGNKCAGATCVPKGSECTSSADCCPGVSCSFPSGGGKGTCGGTTTTADAGTPGNCALYGQTCGETADCCNGVPCTSGRCRYP
ncbi:MAG: hypothetical protein JWP97_1617 [Labilithrix sp.]|nr:hypothetical protein [Labilithrix sp.]